MSCLIHSDVVAHGIDDDDIKIIINKLARKLYENPVYYGFSSCDEISEIFDRYWNRIVSTIKNYSDNRGATFETFFLRTMQFLKINCFHTALRTAQYDYSIIADMINDSKHSAMNNITVYEFDTQS